MKLPPEIQNVLDIAAELAGGIEKVGLPHLTHACEAACPSDLQAAAELLELLLDHLDAELDMGLHGS